MRLFAILAVVLLASSAFAGDEAKTKPKKDGPSAAALMWARDAVADGLREGLKAPEFTRDRDWLNVSRPLTLREDLKGKVVILDFWCYCCINCLHVLPDLAYLEERYKDKPFAVVGVHSAKFANEKDAANIRNAILRHEITHPVVNDADFAIWNDYGASSWPTFAVIAPDGTLIGRMGGEGQRENLDALVQALLEHFEQTAPKTLNVRSLPMRLEKSTRPPGQLSYPGKLVADGTRKSLFIADSGHHRVVEVGLDGRFKRAFGSGERGLVDGPAAKARFHSPQGLAIHEGKLWVCDTENHALRTIDLKTGEVLTVAGTGEKGNHWRLIHPKRNVTAHGPWPGPSTALNSPWDILFLKGVGYIAMAGSHSLWTIDPKTMTLRHFAGDLSERRLDAQDPYKAAFAQPSGLATDGEDLFVADSESSAILRVTPQGAVTTLAGASKDPRDLFHFGDEDGVGLGKRFQHPLGVVFHDGHLWVADSYNHKIKRLDPGSRRVRSRRGRGVTGFVDGAAGALFSEPSGLAVLDGTIYVADANNHAIRTISNPPKRAAALVQTLQLRNVPIPIAHAQGGLSAAWPVIPGTVYPAPIDARLAWNAVTKVHVDIVLPEGWTFTAGAPSMARLVVHEGLRERRPKTIDTPIKGGRFVLEIPPQDPISDGVKVRLLYYVCRDGGSCRIRAVDFTIRNIRAGDTQPSKPIHLRDVFEP